MKRCIKDSFTHIIDLRKWVVTERTITIVVYTTYSTALGKLCGIVTMAYNINDNKSCTWVNLSLVIIFNMKPITHTIVNVGYCAQVVGYCAQVVSRRNHTQTKHVSNAFCKYYKILNKTSTHRQKPNQITNREQDKHQKQNRRSSEKEQLYFLPHFSPNSETLVSTRQRGNPILLRLLLSPGHSVQNWNDTSA